MTEHLMITTIDDLPEALTGLRISGLVGRDEVETTVLPVLDRAEARGHRLRVLCVETGFLGIAGDALWGEVAVGLRP